MRGLLIALMLVAGVARAESVEEKIRIYKESIDSTQREIASVLVLQNFAHFFVETLDQTDVAKQHAYYTSVRHQSFWNQWQLKLRESLAHLVGFIMRRAGGDASVALRVSFV